MVLQEYHIGIASTKVRDMKSVHVNYGKNGNFNLLA